MIRVLQNFNYELGACMREARLRFIEFLLPSGFFVQQEPDFNTLLGFGETFAADAARYNRRIPKGRRDANRVLSAYLLLQYSATLANGDYAEVGTYQGNFAQLIYQNMPSNCSLFCFDSFEGFDARDMQIESHVTGVSMSDGMFSDTGLNSVYNNISGNVRPDRLRLIKGYFPDTFSACGKREWRFVNIDCDLYAPALAALELFWPRLVPGGVLLCHDYNHLFTGIRKAVDEYFHPLGIVPTPLFDKCGSCVVIKPKVVSPSLNAW